jgi:hypothetical protein
MLVLARRAPRLTAWTTGRRSLTLICGGTSLPFSRLASSCTFCEPLALRCPAGFDRTGFRSVIHVQQTFGPLMVHQENPSVIINTGSKQGITNPPYVITARMRVPEKVTTNFEPDSVATPLTTPRRRPLRVLRRASHGSCANNIRTSLRTSSCSFFLIVPISLRSVYLVCRPGWTHTGMTGGDSIEKPAGAWTAQQTVQYMLERVRLGYFYIIAPDNETSPHLDRLKMQWAMDDVTQGRPALSRWHPDFKREYEEFVREGTGEQRKGSPTTREV